MAFIISDDNDHVYKFPSIYKSDFYILENRTVFVLLLSSSIFNIFFNDIYNILLLMMFICTGQQTLHKFTTCVLSICLGFTTIKYA